MTEFSFELATETDDPALRHLLASTPMPGRLTVSFQREPNYFLGCPTMGPFWQVVVARHQPTGEIAAVACRAVRPCWINGQTVDLGYIGQIRVAEAYRSQWLLWRGVDFFRDLHTDGKTALYLGAISDENRVSRGLLIEKPSRRFPKAREVAQIHTLGIILRRPKPALASPYQMGSISAADLPDLVAFLQAQGARKQFFPVYTEADFSSAVTRGLSLDDWVVARQDGRIVGAAGLWDQAGYKQSIVYGYEGSLRWLRPLYNAGLRLIGARPLTAIGEHIHSVYASFIGVENNDPAIFRVLMRQLYNRATERRYAYLMLGLTVNDPLLPVAREYAHITYYSRAYLAGWESLPDLEPRIPYIEIAAL